MVKNKIKILFILICFIQFLYLFIYRSNFEYHVLKNSFKKDFGANYVIPKEVKEINKFIKKHNIKNFALSSTLKNNLHLYQRITEFNYPARIKNGSEFIFILKNENLTCLIIETGDFINLLKC